MISKVKIVFFLAIVLCIKAHSQPYVADKIVGVVGQSAILYSDIEEQYLQAKAQRISQDRCEIFEDLLAQKLLVTQAGKDSIEVTAAEVEMELENRINYFINQIGTEEKLTEYFGKSLLEIKDDMRDAVRDQLLMQRMQANIVKEVTITPTEVKDYYNSLPKDSLPYIDSEIQIAQIMVYPKSDENAVFEVKDKLLELRERVLNGESFSTLAVLYSEGPSASRGGDIGWASRSDLDPAYTKAALALKNGQVSKIVETSFGYHIIQLIDKNGDRLHTKHILMKPQISADAKIKATRFLDSLAGAIRKDSITFKKAAFFFSADKDTRMNSGIRVNPQTQTTKFKVNEFSTSEYYIIRNLHEGEISKAFESTDDKGKTVYKIIQLKSRSEPHVANLKEDFNLLQQMATQNKQSKFIDKWVSEKAKTTYIRLEEPYNNCSFNLDVWNKYKK